MKLNDKNTKFICRILLQIFTNLYFASIMIWTMAASLYFITSVPKAFLAFAIIGGVVTTYTTAAMTYMAGCGMECHDEFMTKYGLHDQYEQFKKKYNKGEE